MLACTAAVSHHKRCRSVQSEGKIWFSSLSCRLPRFANVPFLIGRECGRAWVSGAPQWCPALFSIVVLAKVIGTLSCFFLARLACLQGVWGTSAPFDSSCCCSLVPWRPLAHTRPVLVRKYTTSMNLSQLVQLTLRACQAHRAKRMKSKQNHQ